MHMSTKSRDTGLCIVIVGLYCDCVTVVAYVVAVRLQLCNSDFTFRLARFDSFIHTSAVDCRLRIHNWSGYVSD